MATPTTKGKTSKVVKKVKTQGVIAVDNGGNNTKVYSETMDKPIHFSSRKGIGFHDEDYLNQSSERDMYIEWNDEVYFSGALMLDSPYEISGLEDSKTTDFFVLNLLIAVAKYGYDINKVITDVPFSRLTKDEVQGIKDRLIGSHKISINGESYTFEIVDVAVVGEGVIACHAFETNGLVRWIDLGSRTVAFATSVYNEEDEIPLRPLKKQSGTIEGEGLDIRSLTRGKKPSKTDYTNYVNHLLPTLKRNKWLADDYVIAFGGGALIEDLIESLQEKFPKLEVAEDALYVQVIGMLVFALNYVWTEEDDLDGEE